jgi:uncharacterized small protein (DUF1192 family)
MADLATLQAQLAAVKSSMRSGQLIVKYQDRSITYRSVEELRNIIADLEAEIGRVGGTPRKRAVRMRQSGRGL